MRGREKTESETERHRETQREREMDGGRTRESLTPSHTHPRLKPGPQQPVSFHRNRKSKGGHM